LAIAGPAATGGSPAAEVARSRVLRAPISELVIGGIRNLGFDVDAASALSRTADGVTVWGFGVRGAGERQPAAQPGAVRVPIGVLMLERGGAVENVHTLWVTTAGAGPTIEWEATTAAKPSCSLRLHVVPAAGASPASVVMSLVERSTGEVRELATVPAGPGYRFEDVRFSLNGIQGFDSNCFWNCLKNANILLSAAQLAFLAGCIGAAAVASLASGGAAVPAVIPVITGCLWAIGGFILVSRVGTVAGCAIACTTCP
jgi:hypothetical protein